LGAYGSAYKSNTSSIQATNSPLTLGKPHGLCRHGLRGFF
jgi:hypothetical protein